MADHSDHGLGDAELGPDDPDCMCRGTSEQRVCALIGCGFCGAAENEWQAHLDEMNRMQIRKAEERERRIYEDWGQKE